MDWMWSFKDSLFYGICSCSGASHVGLDPIPDDKCDYPLRLKSFKRNSVNGDHFYNDLDKMRQNGLFTTAVQYGEKSNDFLSLLEKMQSQRLDDQRCEMPGRNSCQYDSTVLMSQILIELTEPKLFLVTHVENVLQVLRCMCAYSIQI
ncbi:unnamed protein product [Auanema sp. JU1783]|nr:unnamed protein product [Auanema sp. JU1783]